MTNKTKMKNEKVVFEEHRAGAGFWYKGFKEKLRKILEPTSIDDGWDKQTIGKRYGYGSGFCTPEYLENYYEIYKPKNFEGVAVILRTPAASIYHRDEKGMFAGHYDNEYVDNWSVSIGKYTNMALFFKDIFKSKTKIKRNVSRKLSILESKIKTGLGGKIK